MMKTVIKKQGFANICVNQGRIQVTRTPSPPPPTPTPKVHLNTGNEITVPGRISLSDMDRLTKLFHSMGYFMLPGVAALYQLIRLHNDCDYGKCYVPTQVRMIPMGLDIYILPCGSPNSTNGFQFTIEMAFNTLVHSSYSCCWEVYDEE